MGGFDNEIPLLLSSLYLSNDGETAPPCLQGEPFGFMDFRFQRQAGLTCDPMFGDTSQVGSLAGAAHLLHINAGVLRQAQ